MKIDAQGAPAGRHFRTSSGVVVALGLLGWRMHSSGRSQDREYTKQLVEVVRTEVGHVRDDVRELCTDFRELRADVADIGKRPVAVETTLLQVLRRPWLRESAS